jgi:hypothetical protein
MTRGAGEVRFFLLSCALFCIKNNLISFTPNEPTTNDKDFSEDYRVETNSCTQHHDLKIKGRSAFV